MAYAGSHTKNTGTWLLPDDENAFDLAVHELFRGAAWRCDQPGPRGLHPVHLHRSLDSAMACGANSTQAFLHLPFGASLPPMVDLADGLTPPDGPPSAAMVQFLRSKRRHGAGGVFCHHPVGEYSGCDAYLGPH